MEGAEEDVVRCIPLHFWPCIQTVALEVHEINDRVARLCAFLVSVGFSVQHAVDEQLQQLGLDNYYVYATRLK